jgi:hypothetical protein
MGKRDVLWREADATTPYPVASKTSFNKQRVKVPLA